MKKVEIYTMNNCGYCEAAKKLLKEHGLAYSEFNISTDDAMRISLIQKTGHRTLPQIFIDEKFIGGYTELKAHLAVGLK